jgi:hypothetical protein
MNLRLRDQDGRTALWNACMDGDLQELKWLCANGAALDVTVADHAGTTPREYKQQMKKTLNWAEVVCCLCSRLPRRLL